MAKSHTMVAALLLVMAVSLAALEGVHGVCGMSNDEFKLCQPAAAVNNPTDSPSAECCAALGKANLSCICRYKGIAGIWLRMYHIDANRAMALPGLVILALGEVCVLWSHSTIAPTKRKDFLKCGHQELHYERELIRLKLITWELLRQ
ncbi:Putative lipid-transfer protein DIR1 [Triticum urartu]|uniref:Putative lipid-transfer protein DIR1 n=1 Tax=Triticum urartu TaxID=4572 RepID=M8AQ64_TRIUA|nr:Putative lipid-transfer protein DIR1 [Triticum urartu]